MTALVVAVVVVALLPHVPLAGLLVRPLVWLSTLVHEGGHGIASLVVGCGFAKLEIFFDASGVAHSARGAEEAWQEAVISLGGLIGPAVASAVFLGFGVVPAFSRVALVVTGAACIVACATVASGFAVVVAGCWGVVFVACGVALTGSRARVALLVLAVELAGSVFSRGDYLFTGSAKTGAGEMPSDVAHVADALGGHWLVWGCAIALLSVALLGAGLLAFFAGDALLARVHAWRVVRASKRKAP